MPAFRVFMVRKRVITEHCVVLVNSSSEKYAEREAKITPKADWNEESITNTPVEIISVNNLDPEESKG